MNQLNALHRYYIALALIALILLVTGNAFAQSPRISDLTPEQQRAQDIQDLRFMQKEVARMRYSEFCATVPKLPRTEILKSIEEAAKSDAGASELMDFLMPIVARYNKNGCGET